MQVLVIGSGGREHALVWKIRQSPLVDRVYCAPGNPGIARLATCVPIAPTKIGELAAFAESERIGLTVVGPELPLTLGLRETFTARGLRVFGASRLAAEIESSKVFAKEFMRRHGIPSAASEMFASSADAVRYLDSAGTEYPLVIKADGLAAGKGVVICPDRAIASETARGMLDGGLHGAAGNRVIVEEFLEGREASFFAISDGKAFLPLASCQDFKRVGEGDEGPNTGGMGAYSPSVYLDAEASREICERIIAPTLSGMAAEGRAYCGVLYTGLMLTSSGPRVLEYNARFGDPEAQVLLPRVASDLVPLLAAAAEERLGDAAVSWRAESAATVVLAADGYPGQPRTGMTIRGIDDAESLADVVVFQAGTSQGPGADPLVSGGRVLAVTALGKSLGEAARRAYEGAAKIAFDGMHYRKDIARDAVRALAARPAAGA